MSMNPSAKEAIRDAIMALDCGKAARLINRESGFNPVIDIRLAEGSAIPPGVALWQVISGSLGRLWLHAAFKSDFGHASRLAEMLPLIWAYHIRTDPTPGTVAINLGDADQVAGLGFCSNHARIALIPDPNFLESDGYKWARDAYARNNIAWEDRTPVAFWRGATTGLRHEAEWRTLPRIRLCEIAGDESLFDVGLSNIVRMSDQTHIDAITALGIVKGHVSARTFDRYRYQIDIDGNTNSWPGLFLKLLTGSPVLKVASELNFRQWYYDRLIPWRNFVPVAADMSDLVEKTRWLRDHDAEARQIGINGRMLAESMDMESELNRIFPTVTQAIATSVSKVPTVIHDGNCIGAIATPAQDLMKRLHGTDIYAGFVPTFPEDLQGWNSHHPVFIRAISELKPAVVIDVGVWKGASTLFLADALHRHGDGGVVIAVDTFLGSWEHGIVGSELYGLIPRRHGLSLQYEQFMTNVVRSNAQDRIIPFPQSSTAAATILRHAGVTAGLIHIDASHDYEDVLRDARAYWEILEPGGYLVGDDYHPTWPGVVQAADEFAHEKGVILTIDSPKWIVRKP
jgi:hypothetical protein